MATKRSEPLHHTGISLHQFSACKLLPSSPASSATKARRRRAIRAVRGAEASPRQRQFSAHEACQAALAQNLRARSTHSGFLGGSALLWHPTGGRNCGMLRGVGNTCWRGARSAPRLKVGGEGRVSARAVASGRSHVPRHECAIFGTLAIQIFLHGRHMHVGSIARVSWNQCSRVSVCPFPCCTQTRSLALPDPL